MLDEIVLFFVELLGNLWGVLKETIGNAIAIGGRAIKRGGKL